MDYILEIVAARKTLCQAVKNGTNGRFEIQHMLLVKVDERDRNNNLYEMDDVLDQTVGSDSSQIDEFQIKKYRLLQLEEPGVHKGRGTKRQIVEDSQGLSFSKEPEPNMPESKRICKIGDIAPQVNSILGSMTNCNVVDIVESIQKLAHVHKKRKIDNVTTDVKSSTHEMQAPTSSDENAVSGSLVQTKGHGDIKENQTNNNMIIVATIKYDTVKKEMSVEQKFMQTEVDGKINGIKQSAEDHIENSSGSVNVQRDKSEDTLHYSDEGFDFIQPDIVDSDNSPDWTLQVNHPKTNSLPLMATTYYNENDEQYDILEPFNSSSGSKKETATSTLLQLHTLQCFFCPDKPLFTSWIFLGKHMMKDHCVQAIDGRIKIDCLQQDCKKCFYLTTPNDKRAKVDSLSQLRRKLGDVLCHMRSKHDEEIPESVKVFSCPVEGCPYTHVIAQQIRKHKISVHKMASEAELDMEQTTGKPNFGTNELFAIEKLQSPSHNGQDMDVVNDIEFLKIIKVEDTSGTIGIGMCNPDSGNFTEESIPIKYTTGEIKGECPSFEADVSTASYDMTQASGSTLLDFHTHHCFLCPDQPLFNTWKVLGKHMVKEHCVKARDGRRQIYCVHPGCNKSFYLTTPNDHRTPVASLSQLRRKLGDILFHMHNKHYEKFPESVKVLSCSVEGCDYIHVVAQQIRKHQIRAHKISSVSDIGARKNFNNDEILDQSDIQRKYNVQPNVEFSNNDSSEAYPYQSHHDSDANNACDSDGDDNEKWDTDNEDKDNVLRSKHESSENKGYASNSKQNQVNLSSNTTNTPSSTLLDFHSYHCFFCPNIPVFNNWTLLGKHMVKEHCVRARDGRRRIHCLHPGCDKSFYLTTPNDRRTPVASLSQLRRKLGDILFHIHSKHVEDFPESVKVLSCPIAGCDYTHVVSYQIKKHEIRVHKVKSTTSSVFPMEQSFENKKSSELSDSPIRFEIDDSGPLFDKGGEESHFFDTHHDSDVSKTSDTDEVDYESGTDVKDGEEELYSEESIESSAYLETTIISSGSNIIKTSSSTLMNFHTYHCFLCQNKPLFSAWKLLGKHVLKEHCVRARDGRFKIYCLHQGCRQSFLLTSKNDKKTPMDSMTQLRKKLADIVYHTHSKHNEKYPESVKILKCMVPQCDFTHIIEQQIRKHHMKVHEALVDCNQFGEKLPIMNMAMHKNSLCKGLVNANIDKLKQSVESECTDAVDGTDTALLGVVGNSDKGDTIENENCETPDGIACSSGLIGTAGSTPVAQYKSFLPKRKRGKQNKSTMTFEEYKCFFCTDEPSFKGWPPLARHIYDVHCSESSEGHWHIDCRAEFCPKSFKLKGPRKFPFYELGKRLPYILFHICHKHSIAFPNYVVTFRCVEEGCGHQCLSESALASHVYSKHTEARRQYGPCDQCGKVMKINHIDIHKSAHCQASDRYNDPAARKQCETCVKSFKTKSALSAHVRKVHRNKVPKFVCEICCHIVNIPAALDEHMFKKHNHNPKELPVRKCELCDFQTVWERQINIHLKRNHNKPRKVCPNCGVSFFDSGAYHMHMEKHSSKTYECSQCSYSTKHRCYYRRHIRAQHEQVKFPCKYCPYKSGYWENTLKHMKSCAKKQGQ